MHTVWCDQRPPRYEVIHEAGDDMCTVVFYTDVREIRAMDADAVYYAAALSLTTAFTPGILRNIRENYREWLAMAAENRSEKPEISEVQTNDN